MNTPTLPCRRRSLLTIIGIFMAATIVLGGIAFAIVAMKKGTVPVPPTGIEGYR